MSEQRSVEVYKRRVANDDPVARIVRGALVGAIKDHGPITTKWIESAAKRVCSQLRGAAMNEVVDFGRGGNTERRLARKLEELKHGHKIALERYDRLSAKCRALEAENERLRSAVAS